jgi:hypothetical protein
LVSPHVGSRLNISETIIMPRQLFLFVRILYIAIGNGNIRTKSMHRLRGSMSSDVSQPKSSQP